MIRAIDFAFWCYFFFQISFSGYFIADNISFHIPLLVFISAPRWVASLIFSSLRRHIDRSAPLFRHTFRLLLARFTRSQSTRSAKRCARPLTSRHGAYRYAMRMPPLCRYARLILPARGGDCPARHRAPPADALPRRLMPSMPTF